MSYIIESFIEYSLSENDRNILLIDAILDPAEDTNQINLLCNSDIRTGLFKEKGLPKNISNEIQKKYSICNEDIRFVSWLSSEEFAVFLNLYDNKNFSHEIIISIMKNIRRKNYTPYFVYWLVL